jgi:hypothetical protein
MPLAAERPGETEVLVSPFGAGAKKQDYLLLRTVTAVPPEIEIFDSL